MQQPRAAHPPDDPSPASCPPTLHAHHPRACSNRVLRINLMISIMSFGVVVCTAPAAYFGMNLSSGKQSAKPPSQPPARVDAACPGAACMGSEPGFRHVTPTHPRPESKASHKFGMECQTHLGDKGDVCAFCQARRRGARRLGLWHCLAACWPAALDPTTPAPTAPYSPPRRLPPPRRLLCRAGRHAWPLLAGDPDELHDWGDLHRAAVGILQGGSALLSYQLWICGMHKLSLRCPPCLHHAAVICLPHMTLSYQLPCGPGCMRRLKPPSRRATPTTVPFAARCPQLCPHLQCFLPHCPAPCSGAPSGATRLACGTCAPSATSSCSTCVCVRARARATRGL